MTGSSSDIGRLKYGKDAKLEADANKWLAQSVGENKRSIARDVEKMAYEGGHRSLEELCHYDPVNDWATRDSAFSIAVDPGEVDWVESTICAEVDDGNIRRRHDQLLERKALMRHVGDSDSWGSDVEGDIPALGINNGDRKVCSNCGRSKGLDLFYGNSRSKDGLHSWCKSCLKRK